MDSLERASIYASRLILPDGSQRLPLYVGSTEIVEDMRWLAAKNIGVVVDVSEKAAPRLQTLAAKLKQEGKARVEEPYWHVRVDGVALADKSFDNTLTPMDFWKFMSAAADVIADGLEHEANVLVVSREGVNRSLCAVAAYLILYEEVSFFHAIVSLTKTNQQRARAVVRTTRAMPEIASEWEEKEVPKFPAFTNPEFKTAICHLKGAFSDGDENAITMKYYQNWQEKYIAENAA